MARLEETPFVSIIIPAFNEAEFISSCLESVKRLDYPADRFEVIVVDNGSTDDTVAIATGLGVPVLVHPEVRIGQLRNLGAKEARGEILAFVDSDCIVPKDWIRSALSILSREEVGAVGGPCPCREDGVWIEKAWALNRGEWHTEVESLTTGSFIVKREIFDRIGGFHGELVAGEDTEISRRIRESGYRLWLDTGCHVIHLGYPRTVAAFVKRQVWHSSDYLMSIRGSLNKTMLLTMVFLASAVAGLFCLALGMNRVALISLLIWFAVPLVTTAVRLSSCVDPKTPRLVVSVFIVQLLYFCGRSTGLTISFFRKISGRYS